MHKQQAKCPMGSWAQSVEDVEGARCHRAWMAHDPSNAMPRCPLGSPGISITAAAGSAGTDLSLLATKPEDVQEIRKRSHAALSK